MNKANVLRFPEPTNEMLMHQHLEDHSRQAKPSDSETSYAAFFNVNDPMIIEVTGESAECGIADGDAILVSLGDRPVNGDTVVFRLENGECTAWKWRTRLTLVTSTPEPDRYEILGVVRFIFKRLA